ncbi:tyrosine-type recombinase/integrase [Enterococcus faecalis]|uniref:site-specific integrase n=1 Tax=Enterococcus faecalis TaxID=1351 RepID=UPI0012E2EB54|nr:site-specific integrase [Enterococcus faecalis]EGO5016490.1 site-specific integrase [Enterococcus faecalis]EGO6561361.1 site-specific integrase [Enterococcus faecalis]EGO7559027.1 site-specific integrase [Enterococcus faecalis]EGO7742156.1 site-specific integrase [Enterococcus faecalis]EGO8387419.1 site-specific integrase [Enterococcus faecalis]
MSVSFQHYTKYNQKLWRFKCYFGRNEIGEEIRTTRSGFKTKKDAQRVYHQLQFDFDKNFLKMGGNITFEELYEEFIEQYRSKVKPSTIMITRRAIEDHALQYFGNKKIKEITVRFCTQINRRWVRDGFKQAYYFRRAVAQILQYAVQQEMIQSNPMRKTEPIKRQEIDEHLVATETMTVYTPKELALFLECCRKHGNMKIETYFRVLSYTGARKSEILALEWNDINFESKKLIISKTLAEVESDPNTKTTKVACQSAKTNAAKRTISIDSETMRMLEEWRVRQQFEFTILGLKATNKHQLIFPNKENRFCHPGQVNDWYDMIFTKYKLNKRITIHEFRKTHVSLCAMADMNLEDIMYRVGHKDSKMTRQVYNYFYPEREERSADQFAQFIEKEQYLF